MIRRKPYDAEIEYLESTGTQWIDVPVDVSAGQYFEVSGEAIFKYDGNTRGMVFASNVARQFEGNFYSYNATNNRIIYASIIGSVATNGGWIGQAGQTNTFKVSTLGVTRNEEFLENVRPITTGFSTLRLMAGYAGVSEFSNSYNFPVQHIKVVVGNRVVFDAIPVRVGTVGYLYDRVSGQLFGNQGTGAFVLGPDVSDGESVMRLHNYPKPPSAQDYIQDGLVAMWDGIENAGWGVHNSTATTWKDLVGNHDMTIGGTGSFMPNAFYSNGVSSAILPSGISLVYTEVALNFMSSSSADCGVLAISSGGFRHGIQKLANGNGICGGYSSWGHRYDPGVPFTIGVEKKSAFEQNGIAFNGIMNTGWDYGRGGLSTLSSYGVSYSTHPFVGYIHAIRAYSRALTAEEIAHNYAIDKERFGLP